VQTERGAIKVYARLISTGSKFIFELKLHNLIKINILKIFNGFYELNLNFFKTRLDNRS
jgi:hypothetical protein